MQQLITPNKILLLNSSGRESAAKKIKVGEKLLKLLI
jgi:hypothetical protein